MSIIRSQVQCPALRNSEENFKKINDNLREVERQTEEGKLDSIPL